MLQLKNVLLSGVASLLVLSTACTIKGSGSERVRYGANGAADATASQAEAPVDQGAACLKLAEKRKQALKLQDEETGAEDPGTEDPGTEDPGAEDPGAGACEPAAEEPAAEEPAAEEPAAE